MYAYMKGTLVFSSPMAIVLETHGIGFSILIPHHVYGKLPQIGEQVQVYTTFVVRELLHALYGFLSMEEKQAFELLLNVTGVGPKLALSLIGHLPLDQLRRAINERDLLTLCRVPGVGKKTAERLVVELKDKIDQLCSIQETVQSFSVPQEEIKGIRIQDAVLAMINLGYNQSTAQKAIQKTLNEFPECPNLAALITFSLKNI